MQSQDVDVNGNGKSLRHKVLIFFIFVTCWHGHHAGRRKFRCKIGLQLNKHMQEILRQQQWHADGDMVARRVRTGNFYERKLGIPFKSKSGEFVTPKNSRIVSSSWE